MPKINLPIIVLVFLMALIAVINVSNGLHYPLYTDDSLLQETYRNYGIGKGALYLFNNCNGRLVSHLLSLCVVPWMSTNKYLISAFYLVNVLLFVLVLSAFLKSFFIYRYGVQLTWVQALITGSVFYSLFFLFFFGKRFDFWYFIAAVFIYQYSLILILGLNGILFRKRIEKITGLLVIISSACIGLMSESNAIGQLVILGFLFAYKKDHRKWILTSAGLIIISMAINYLSGGNGHKMVISKTHVDNLNTYVGAFRVLINDLVFNWDRVNINSLGLHMFNGVFIQAGCVFFLFLFIKYLRANWLVKSKPEMQSRSIFSVAILALSVMIITYLVPAGLYANVLDYIPDRCKLIGCFFIFLSLIDIGMMAGYSKTLSR